MECSTGLHMRGLVATCVMGVNGELYRLSDNYMAGLRSLGVKSQPKNFLPFLKPEDREKTVELLRFSAETRKSYPSSGEVELNGKILTSEWINTPYYTSSGALSHFYAIGTISEKTKDSRIFLPMATPNACAQCPLDFRPLFNRRAVSEIKIWKDGRVLESNDSADILYGEPLQGFCIFNILGCSQHETSRELSMLRMSEKHHRSYHREIQCLGKHRRLSIVVTPIFNHIGDLGYFNAILTHQKE